MQALFCLAVERLAWQLVIKGQVLGSCGTNAPQYTRLAAYRAAVQHRFTLTALCLAGVSLVSLSLSLFLCAALFLCGCKPVSLCLCCMTTI